MTNLRRFFSRWQNWLGFILVLIFVAVALAAPLLSPQNPNDFGYFKRVGRFADMNPNPPGENARLGTLPGQYDVFHTLVWGTRNALQFGLLVALLSAVFGILFGAVAGYAGGTVNGVMMRIADAFLAFPVIAGVVFLQQLVAISIEAAGGVFAGPNMPLIVEPTGQESFIQTLLNIVDPLMLSLIVFSWMPYARLVNSMVIGVKNMEFIQATRALGASPLRIVGRHLIPNSVSPAIVLAARDVGSVVLLQATLTFIQIGGNSPWGELLARGRNFMLGPGGSLLTYWWVYIPATLAVVLFGVSWNLLGDGINDVMSPDSFVHVERSSRAHRKKEKEKEAARSQKRPSPNAFSSSVARRFSFAPNPVLSTARNAVGHRDLEGALHAYAHLVAHNRWVNDVIRDLAQVAKKFPHEPQVWQVLGDALAQNGETEDAQRAYTRAKELTRIPSNESDDLTVTSRF
jgi:peptide/nickel transport system permease protein